MYSPVREMQSRVTEPMGTGDRGQVEERARKNEPWLSPVCACAGGVYWGCVRTRKYRGDSSLNGGQTLGGASARGSEPRGARAETPAPTRSRVTVPASPHLLFHWE